MCTGWKKEATLSRLSPAIPGESVRGPRAAASLSRLQQATEEPSFAETLLQRILGFLSRSKIGLCRRFRVGRWISYARKGRRERRQSWVFKYSNELERTYRVHWKISHRDRYVQLPWTFCNSKDSLLANKRIAVIPLPGVC